MQINTKQRILMSKSLLTELAELARHGVPISRLIRDNSLSISQPVLSKLIQYHDLSITHDDKKLKLTIYYSIFPDWLDTKPIQNPPSNYSYEGLFPFGIWVKHVEGNG